MKESLFDAVGGFATLDNVHKIFYDKIYVHPWLKHFFEGHDQQIIEKKQTLFMAWKMGGPNDYRGRDLKMSHRAMYITEELFDLRQALLRESLQEAGVTEPLIVRWLKIDSAFKKMLVKDSIASFYNYTWEFEKRVIVPKPVDC